MCPLHPEKGFKSSTLEIDESVRAIEEAYPSCKVLPASRLELDQEGIDNGDITTLTAGFLVGVSA